LHGELGTFYEPAGRLDNRRKNGGCIRPAKTTSWLNLAATDEKDLSTSQSPTQTDPRLHGADGNAGRAQRAQTPTQQGPPSAGHLDPAQAAGLEPATARFGFGSADRLRRSGEFARIRRAGLRFQTTYFVVYAAKSPDTERTRLGVTVSRRVGKAVARNRIKRRIRECFRLSLRDMLPQGTDMVVIARRGAAALDTPAINAELRTATLYIRRKLKNQG
jgi:ribonuclease P protein component